MNLFRGLTFAENCLCIYRDSCVSKKRKFFVIVFFIVQICVSLAIIASHVTSAFANNHPREVIIMFNVFGLLTLLKNMIITIGGLANAGSHKIFLESISNLDKHFKNDPSYSNSEKKLKRKCLVVSILFVTLAILLLGDRIGKGFFIQLHSLAEVVAIAICDFWVDIRYMLEHLVIYCAIKLICEYVKCLNKAVREVLDKYRNDENKHILNADEGIEIAKKVSYWAEVYQNILMSSKQMSKCFNGVMFLSLVVTLLRTVWSIYEIIGMMVALKSLRIRPQINVIVYNLVYHMGATISLLFAGQKLQNEFGNLNISLASLANQVSIYDQKSVIRSLRDLNRIVTTNPIVIKFGSFTLGMNLLPMILSLSATYIVVMLQFNHVI